MILKKFNDDYDAEFVNLMLDIQERIDNFCKSDKLKINSWAKVLCIPTINVEFKKNRNLYAIKLLDNVLNGKLEDPFNKFAKDKELKTISPILVKTQLSDKFLNEIQKYQSSDNILRYENQNYAEFNPRNHLNEKLDKAKKSNTVKNFNQRDNRRKNTLNKKLYVDYDNQFLLVPSCQKRNNSFYKTPKFRTNDSPYVNNYFNYDLNEQGLRPSDILLIKNFGNLPYKNKSNFLNLKSYKFGNYEKYKLKSIIDILNDQRQENNEIILSQKSEIDKLKRKISSMQLKVKRIYDAQK
jgi:hypothetical protein